MVTHKSSSGVRLKSSFGLQIIDPTKLGYFSGRPRLIHHRPSEPLDNGESNENIGAEFLSRLQTLGHSGSVQPGDRRTESASANASGEQLQPLRTVTLIRTACILHSSSCKVPMESRSAEGAGFRTREASEVCAVALIGAPFAIQEPIVNRRKALA